MKRERQESRASSSSNLSTRTMHAPERFVVGVRWTTATAAAVMMAFCHSSLLEQQPLWTCQAFSPVSLNHGAGGFRSSHSVRFDGSDSHPTVGKRPGLSRRWQPHDKLSVGAVTKSDDGEQQHATKQKQQQQQVIEIPTENPFADPTRQSISGRTYGKVLEGIHRLYPPQDLEQRNAKSRETGYWPYVQAGTTPPIQYTYGEFDFYFFAELLDRAAGYVRYQTTTFNSNRTITWEDAVFCDIGSGVGRLVIASAALHPAWKLCKGIEILSSLHQQAQATLEMCKSNNSLLSNHDLAVVSDSIDGVVDQSNKETGINNDDEPTTWMDAVNRLIESAPASEPSTENTDAELTSDTINKESIASKNQIDDTDDQTKPGKASSLSLAYGDSATERFSMAPIQFICGSLDDPYVYFGDCDCIFSFASCMPKNLLEKLAQAIGRQCRPGTIVITTDQALPLIGYCDPYEYDERVPSGPFELDLIETVDGYGWVTGGTSTAFIHSVKTSLWSAEQGPLSPKDLSVQDKAYQVVKSLEKGELGDPRAFIRAVYNDMVFANLPDRFLPNLGDE